MLDLLCCSDRHRLCRLLPTRRSYGTHFAASAPASAPVVAAALGTAALHAHPPTTQPSTRLLLPPLGRPGHQGGHRGAGAQGVQGLPARQVGCAGSTSCRSLQARRPCARARAAIAPVLQPGHPASRLHLPDRRHQPRQLRLQARGARAAGARCRAQEARWWGALRWRPPGRVHAVEGSGSWPTLPCRPPCPHPACLRPPLHRPGPQGRAAGAGAHLRRLQAPRQPARVCALRAARGRRHASLGRRRAQQGAGRGGAAAAAAGVQAGGGAALGAASKRAAAPALRGCTPASCPAPCTWHSASAEPCAPRRRQPPRPSLASLDTHCRSSSRPSASWRGCW